MAASPSQLPLSGPPNSEEEEEEEVSPILNITKALALKSNENSTLEHMKGLIQCKEQIDTHSMQLFFGGNRLEDGKRLVDYGIHSPPTLHGIPQTQDSEARMTVNVIILSAEKNLLVEARLRDTVQDVKLMIQAKEGIAPNEFDLLFSGKVLSEDRTLASLDLLQVPTFHLVFRPKCDVSVIVDMSSRRVTLDAKLWYTVRDIKAIVGAMTSAQVMSMHMVYQGKQLEDHKLLACYDIADGSVLQLVFPSAPFQIFVKRGNAKTVALQVSMTDTVKEVENKLLHKLQVSVPAAKLHEIAHVGERLADDRELASYGIEENSTLLEIISPRSR